MLNFIKNLFNKQPKIDLERKALLAEQQALKAIVKRQQGKAYFWVNRHYISSVTQDDLDGTLEGMTENEKKEYLANASLVWSNPVFEKELKKILGSQILFVAAECQNWEQSLIGRGSINGIGLVEDRFKRLHSMHLDNLSNSRSNEGNGKYEEGVLPKV